MCVANVAHNLTVLSGAKKTTHVVTGKLHVASQQI